MDTNSKKITELNDSFRTTGIGGKILMTRGIADLDQSVQFAIMQKVRDFDTFTEDNDPYGEHDFGSFDHEGVKIFWKIDYYDAHHSAIGSEDPSDPEQTMRVLTVMLASEY